MQENSMTIQFNVTNQTLRRTSSENIVENSENYLYAQFTFSSDWDNVTKYAIVEGSDLRYKIQLDENDRCKIPASVIKYDGFYLMLVGENTNHFVVITTTNIHILVLETNYQEAPSPDIKHITSNDESINVVQDSDIVDLSIPNIYFKDANLTNHVLNFLGRNNQLLKSLNMPYGLVDNITLALDNTTYTLTLNGYDRSNNLLFSRSVDFNIETKIFKTIYYDSQTEELVFVTMDDEEIRVPIGDLLTGIATQTWVTTNFVQKEVGKGLSANDFTNELKTKLEGIENGANVNVQADWNESDSEKDEYIKNKPTIPSKTSELTNDSGFIDNTYHDNSKQDVIDSDHKLSADLVNDSTSTNKFVSASEKAQITTNANAINNIKDGQSLDSFSDVESAISNVTLSGDNTSIEINSKVISVKDSYIENFFATDQEVDTMLEEVFG